MMSRHSCLPSVAVYATNSGRLELPEDGRRSRIGYMFAGLHRVCANCLRFPLVSHLHCSRPCWQAPLRQRVFLRHHFEKDLECWQHGPQ